MKAREGKKQGKLEGEEKGEVEPALSKDKNETR